MTEPSDGRADTSPADELIASGNHLEDRGDFPGAARCYEGAIALLPSYPRAHMNSGNALRKLGRLDQSMNAFRTALHLAPDFWPARFNLGSVLAERGEFAEAELEFNEVLRNQPDLVEALIVLADVVENLGRPQEAERLLIRALEIQPGIAGAAQNLGSLLSRLNRFSEAELWFARARELDPVSCRDALSRYCFSLLLRSDVSVQAIFLAHQRVGRLFARSATSVPSVFPNRRDPGRRLRIGYVSGDFRQHPIGLFMRPVFAAHDPSAFEIHCYSSNENSDPATEVLRGLVPHWHPISWVSDAGAEELIRSHRIDVLVDLAGHTTNSRLGLFGRRAAPVQVTWLGYLNTTGVTAIDYRICDRHAEPEGFADALHTEMLYRLPHSQWCYAPWHDVAIDTTANRVYPGMLTLGSFNQAQKINVATVDLWSSVLRALPNAELLLLDFPDERSRRIVRDWFGARGIAGKRLLFRGREDILGYFRSINSVDIALDSFPYNGATTTLDTLWMGTPLVAMLGDRGVARGGYSIMRSLDMPDLIADTPERYIDIHLRLAQDNAWRATLRRELRAALSRSPLMDARGFVSDLESAYRWMWARWCASCSPSSAPR